MKKPIWKSKTAWAAFEAILAALAGLGAYGFRDAMREDVPGPGAVDFSQWRFEPKAGDEGRE